MLFQGSMHRIYRLKSWCNMTCRLLDLIWDYSCCFMQKHLRNHVEFVADLPHFWVHHSEMQVVVVVVSYRLHVRYGHRRIGTDISIPALSTFRKACNGHARELTPQSAHLHLFQKYQVQNPAFSAFAPRSSSTIVLKVGTVVLVRYRVVWMGKTDVVKWPLVGWQYHPIDAVLQLGLFQPFHLLY